MWGASSTYLPGFAVRASKLHSRKCIAQISIMATTNPSKRLASKSDVLVLHRPKNKKARFTNVQVSVGRGELSIQTVVARKCIFRKPSVDVQYDLKVVWVNDVIDDEENSIKNSFEVVTPEVKYILQATSHRTKIEWMQIISIAISQSLRFRGSYRPSSWSNLDALHKWLTVRDVQYTFSPQGEYRGATYTGKWNNGMPHICGSMKWKNGDRYDGEFVFGKRQGSGTMLWLSDPHMRSYTGNWEDETMEGYGEMMYADQSTYSGWWHAGRRQGHGRMEYKQNAGIYTGAWESDQRTGYGVYDDTTKKSRYLGMWKDDKYHGPGILLDESSFDVAMYSNGEKIAAGNKRASVLLQDEKWEPLFQCCGSMLGYMISVSHTGNVSSSTQSLTASDGDSAVAMDFQEIAASPEMDSSCQNCHANLKGTEECVVCRVEGFKSIDHPLGLLVNNLTKCFIQSYSGVAEHKNLLSHAIGELNSITIRLHQLVRRYCPSVITTNENDLYTKPKTQLTLLLKPKRAKEAKKAQNRNQSKSQADPSWLYPILLPSIFPTLFSLYKAHHSDDDLQLRIAMSTLQRRTDKDLCEILDIKRIFSQWEQRRSSSDELDNVSLSDHLSTAVEIFRHISDYLTPMNKLLCVEEANEEITKVCERLSIDLCGSTGNSLHTKRAKEKAIAPTGLFTLIIIRGGLDFLCSEVQFIQDFTSTSLLTEENGFLLTILKESYYQLKELCMTVNR